MFLQFNISGRPSSLGWLNRALREVSIPRAPVPPEQRGKFVHRWRATKDIKRHYAVWRMYESHVSSTAHLMRREMASFLRRTGASSYSGDDVPPRFTQALEKELLRRDIAHMLLIESLREVVPEEFMSAFTTSGSIDSFFSGWDIVYIAPDRSLQTQEG